MAPSASGNSPPVEEDGRPEGEEGICAPKSSMASRLANDKKDAPPSALIAKGGLTLPVSQERTASRSMLQKVQGTVGPELEVVAKMLFVEEPEVYEEDRPLARRGFGCVSCTQEIHLSDED